MGASRVACASFNIGTNTTITITRDNKAYTHTLKYSFNGATGTIVTKTTQTSYVWNPPASTLYSKIPNVTSGYGTITCETYNGSTLIGTTTCGFYAYTERSVCEPSVSGTVVDTNPATVALTGDSSAIVIYMSKPKCTITTSAKNSATINTIQIENPFGLIATTSPYTFDTAYSNEFHFKATDSRGYSKTAIVYASKCVYYDPCFFYNEPIVTRTESTSTTATANIRGFCYNSTFGATSNALSVQYRYKVSGGEYGNYIDIPCYWGNDGIFTSLVTINDLSLSETYTIEFVVSDKLTSFKSETVLGQSTGDIRIAKNYIQTKNKILVGERENEQWKCVTLHRKLENNYYDMNYGIGAMGGALELRRSKDGSEGDIVARYDIREDGYMYNTLSNMSVGEIMSAVFADQTFGGWLLMNGGGNTPVLIQWGKIILTPSTANVSVYQTINFLNQYSGIPNVFVTAQTQLGVSVEASADYVTSNGCNIYLKRANIASTSVNWIAIGNGANAMPQ